MIQRTETAVRGGGILPFVIASMVALIGFVALSVDLGLLAIARSQCQNAADSAALAGARALNGDASVNNNAGSVATVALAATAANQVLGSSINPSQVTVKIGAYSYNSSTQSFPTAPFTGLTTVTPGTTPPTHPSDNWSLCQVTVTSSVNTFFGKIFGLNAFNTSTVATAAHRPRDIAVIVDFSGSMRFGCLPGIPFTGTRDRTGSGNANNPGSNNPDPVFPKFGHYSDVIAAGLQNTADLTIGGNVYSTSNVTSTTAEGATAIVADFYKDNIGTKAFVWVPADGSDNYAQTSPGDKFMKTNKNTGTAYARTVAELLGSSSTDSTWESNGYRAYNMIPSGQTFNRYTQGPGYYGKTFFMWPPDPSDGSNADTASNARTNDWRQRYFYKSNGSGTSNRCDDNTLLWDSSGRWKAPGSSTSYKINYDAILYWIKNIGPNPFPSQLRSGRIVYYTSIPDTINTSTYPPTDLNQRFWKDYIDFVLGVMQTGPSSWEVITGIDSSQGEQGLTGYGGDYTWGTIKISAKPSGRYMDYADNPKRPRLHFWFGPLTMIDFLGCYNLWYRVTPSASRYCWWPGTCHESPMYQCKLGIQAALIDIKTNHPNDNVALIYFSTPRTSATTAAARYNRAISPLSRNYQRMIDALWYPLSTIDNPGTTINPYDYDSNMEVPRAMGGTCFPYPLMLAYNQFSCNASLQTFNPPPAPLGDAGGLGRKGAQKVVILETDGAPNTTAGAAFVNNGPHNSYYKIRFNSSTMSLSEFPTGVSGYADNHSTVTSQIYSICNQICALETANPPGYSTARKPVLIHCIGFGPLYAPGASGRAAALATLQQIQYIGKTQGSPTDDISVQQPYKIIYGTETQIVNDLQKAFTIILQGGVQVSLLE